MMHRNRHVFDIRLLELTPQQQKRLMLIGFIIFALLILWAPVIRARGFWVAAIQCVAFAAAGAAASAAVIYVMDGIIAYSKGGAFPRGRTWDYQSSRSKSSSRCVNCNCGLSAVNGNVVKEKMAEKMEEEEVATRLKDKLSDDEAADSDERSDNETDSETDDERENGGREEKSRFPQRTSAPPMLESLPLAYEAEVVGDGGGGGDDGGAGDNNYRMWSSTRGWTGHVWSALYGPTDMVSHPAKGEKGGAK